MSSLPDALDAARRTFVTEAAGAVSYYADTARDGVPLVLLHSINAAPSALEVGPLFDHFRGSRPVYAPDLPGFGHSERADRDYSPGLYADGLRQFLAAVVKRPADVVALSTTAEFAARVALAGDPPVRSLTLISPTGMGERQPPSEKTQARLRRAFRLPALGSGLYRLLTTRPSIRYFLGLSFEGTPPEALIRYACETTRQPGARYAPFSFLSMRLFTADAADTLYRPLRVPTLVLYDRDPNVGFERLDALTAGNSLIVSRRIPGTRGMPHWDQPAATFDAMESFWQAPPGAGA